MSQQIIKRPLDIVYNEYVAGADMTDEEKELVVTLFSHSDEEVDIILPDNIKSEQLLPLLNAGMRAIRRLDNAQNKLKPFLGRMFALINDRQDLLDAMEFPGITKPENFTDFMKRVVPCRWNMCASEAFAYMRMAREYYFLPPKVHTALGNSTLKMIAKAVPREGGEITDSVKHLREELAEKGLELKFRELVQYIEDKGICDKETLTPIRIIVQSNHALNSLWYDWITSIPAQSYVGSSDPNLILEAMIVECRETWTAALKAAKGL